MKVRMKDLATIGMIKEGVYKLSIEGVQHVDGIDKNNREYTRIDVNFRVTEDPDGPLRFQPMVFDKFWVHQDRDLDRFMKLYKGVTGDMPSAMEMDSDSGEAVLDTEVLAKELEQNEVWGVVVYKKKGDKTSTDYELATGWSFGQDSDSVRPPRRLLDAEEETEKAPF